MIHPAITPICPGIFIAPFTIQHCPVSHMISWSGNDGTLSGDSLFKRARTIAAQPCFLARRKKSGVSVMYPDPNRSGVSNSIEPTKHLVSMSKLLKLLPNPRDYCHTYLFFIFWGHFKYNRKNMAVSLDQVNLSFS